MLKGCSLSVVAVAKALLLCSHQSTLCRLDMVDTLDMVSGVIPVTPLPLVGRLDMVDRMTRLDRVDRLDHFAATAVRQGWEVRPGRPFRPFWKPNEESAMPTRYKVLAFTASGQQVAGYIESDDGAFDALGKARRATSEAAQKEAGGSPIVEVRIVVQPDETGFAVTKRRTRTKKAATAAEPAPAPAPGPRKR